MCAFSWSQMLHYPAQRYSRGKSLLKTRRNIFTKEVGEIQIIWVMYIETFSQRRLMKFKKILVVSMLKHFHRGGWWNLFGGVYIIFLCIIFFFFFWGGGGTGGRLSVQFYYKGYKLGFLHDGFVDQPWSKSVTPFFGTMATCCCCYHCNVMSVYTAYKKNLPHSQNVLAVLRNCHIQFSRLITWHCHCHHQWFIFYFSPDVAHSGWLGSSKTPTKEVHILSVCSKPEPEG